MFFKKRKSKYQLLQEEISALRWAIECLTDEIETLQEIIIEQKKGDKNNET